MLNRRKKLFIDPQFQVQYLVQLVVIVILIVGALYCANWLFFEKFYSLAREINIPENHPMFRFLNEQQRQMNFVYTLLAIAISIIVLGYGLYNSNRIAGPLSRIQNHLQGLSDGTITNPLDFREDDYFKHLCESLNKYQATVLRRKSG